MTIFKFNANEHVKVKLNKKGEEILKKRHEELNQNLISKGFEGLEKFELNLDGDGYYSSQLWYLMHVFGEHIRLGYESPFELDMIFLHGEPITLKEGE